MGKVRFPVVGIRKDVAGVWEQLFTTESITVPASSPYIVYLTEIPDDGSVQSRPVISGLTYVATYPPGPAQFYVNYNLGAIVFNAAQAGNAYSVRYWAKGSLVEAAEVNYLYNQHVDTFHPTGFVNRNQSTITFDNGTRTFTITPVDANAGFDFYVTAWKYNVTSADNVVINDVDGFYYIYYNSDGVLSQSISNPGYEDVCHVAGLYWDATNNATLGLCDNRHHPIDIRLHENLHNTDGYRYGGTGFDLTYSTLTIGAPTTYAHEQVVMEGGNLYDEDIEITVINDATPINNFEQNLGTALLTTPGQIPVIYKDGTSWRKASATDYPFTWDATQNRLHYNFDNAGSFSRVVIPSEKLAVYWLAGTNSITEPIVSVMHEDFYDNLEAANIDAKWEDITWTGSPPYDEICPLYRLDFWIDSNYTNAAHNARLTQVTDLRRSSNIRSTLTISCSGHSRDKIFRASGLTVSASSSGSWDLEGFVNRGLVWRIITNQTGAATGNYDIYFFDSEEHGMQMYRAIDMSPADDPFEDMLPWVYKDNTGSRKCHVVIVNDDGVSTGTYEFTIHCEQFR